MYQVSSLYNCVFIGYHIIIYGVYHNVWRRVHFCLHVNNMFTEKKYALERPIMDSNHYAKFHPYGF